MSRKNYRKMLYLSIGLMFIMHGITLGIVPAAHAKPDLSGMWSDPPPRAEDAFCHLGCPIEARDYLTKLLDDPANDEKSFRELRAEARRFQREELIPAYLTQETREGRFTMNFRADPSATQCQPWGYSRQVFAPHAMRLTQYEDRVILNYAEWTAERIIWLDGREIPDNYEHSLHGFSTGYYENDTLIVETEGVRADFALSGFGTSDQLYSVERYTRTEDGQRLDLEVTFTDPIMLSKPIVMVRAWAWAPDEEIYPYDACEIME